MRGRVEPILIKDVRSNGARFSSALNLHLNIRTTEGKTFFAAFQFTPESLLRNRAWIC
jgi:hypothetical protein